MTAYTKALKKLGQAASPNSHLGAMREKQNARERLVDLASTPEGRLHIQELAAASDTTQRSPFTQKDYEDALDEGAYVREANKTYAGLTKNQRSKRRKDKALSIAKVLLPGVAAVVNMVGAASAARQGELYSAAYVGAAVVMAHAAFRNAKAARALSPVHSPADAEIGYSARVRRLNREGESNWQAYRDTGATTIIHSRRRG